MTHIEYHRGPWRLRVVILENRRVIGMPSYEDGEIVPQLMLWFVGRMDDDQWFAHGASDYHDEAAADKLFESIDGARMDVLLTFAGYPWEEIEETDVAQLAQLQREFAVKISEEYWADLLDMGRTELEELRAQEEASHHHHGRFN
jgi:hypothetical protein